MFEEFSIVIAQYFILDLVGFMSTLVYLNLIIKQKRSAWYWSILGSAIFSYSCFINQLYLQSVLYIFYVAIAFYGLQQWKQNDTTLKVNSMNFKAHRIFISIGVILGAALGHIFITYTDQQLPYLDGAITVFAIGTTLLVVNKKRENWLYWVVINTASIYLYAHQELWILVVMSLVLLAMAVKGYISWNK